VSTHFPAQHALSHAEKHPFRQATARPQGRLAGCPQPPDPDPAWALRNPEKFLAFLFVSPRPCEALDALLSIDTDAVARS
jgi:hypothetical protein